MSFAADTAAKVEQMYSRLQPKFEDAVEITVEKINESKAQVVYIDVRDRDEQRVSMIPGAITAKQFKRSPEKYKNAQLVAYCTVGYRSGKFAIKWSDKGYNVSNLKGGVLSWAHAGGQFETSVGTPTKRVHVYDEDWNALPEGYEPVW